MTTREAWLQGAIDAFRPWFAEAGHPLPSHIHVSIGFPQRKKAIGECWGEAASSDLRRHIFISPELDCYDTALASPQGVLATLLHECVHAALPSAVGHKKAFQVLAKTVGLEKPWTATTASEPTITKFRHIRTELGVMPSATLSKRLGDKAQTNRHLKCECPECGYVARVAKQHLVAHGAPICPCSNQQMSNPLQDNDGDDDDI